MTVPQDAPAGPVLGEEGPRLAAPGEADRLIVRWQQLTEDQQGEVIDWLARRRPDALAYALDGEEGSRPDGDD